MHEWGSIGGVVTWLRNRSRLLLLAHERPDGDAYGALFGLQIGLRASGRHCSVYLKDPLPRAYQRLFTPVESVYVGGHCPEDGFDGIVCLDVTEWERVDRPPLPELSAQPEHVCVIDHHPGNRWQCAANWVAPDRASTAQMVSCILREDGGQVPPQAATCLLTGLVMDTGAFRFDNTDPEALLEAARLIGEGAQYARVMKEMFLRKPYGRGLLEGRLLQDARFDCDGRLVCSVLDRALLDEYGVHPTETECLVDILKAIDGVEIACLLQPEAEDVRFSMRSTNPQYSVNGIARQLGGGGHALAAGATAKGTSLDKARQEFVRLASLVLSAECAHS